MEARDRIGPRNWALIWIIGMIGQMVWNVENSLFNTFVYRVADKNAEIIITMDGGGQCHGHNPFNPPHRHLERQDR